MLCWRVFLSVVLKMDQDEVSGLDLSFEMELRSKFAKLVLEKVSKTICFFEKKEFHSL